MDSIDPAFCCEEIYHVDEVPSRFLEPCSQPSHVFHFVEEPLDNITHGVKAGVMRDRIARIGLGGNNRQRTFIGDIAPDLRTAIGFVQDHRQRRHLPVEEDIHHLAVMNMAASDLNAQWPAIFIYGHVNFACATAP